MQKLSMASEDALKSFIPPVYLLNTQVLLSMRPSQPRPRSSTPMPIPSTRSGPCPLL